MTGRRGMPVSGELSWRMTDRERRRVFTAAVAAASSVLGPFGPLAVWAFEYLYDRRDLIFNTAGTPVSAYTAGRSALGLTTLSSAIAQPQSTLAINTLLTDAARRLGLRNGDPVSLVLSGHHYIQARSGLVVPTRLGEQVSVSVPNGSYSVAAFGANRQNLFAARDPYTTIAGNTVALNGHHQLALPLAARTAPAPPPATTSVPTWLNARILANGTCIWCGTATANLLSHTVTCPRKPAPQLRCDRCSATFATRAELDRHLPAAHPFINWVRTWW